MSVNASDTDSAPSSMARSLFVGTFPDRSSSETSARAEDDSIDHVDSDGYAEAPERAPKTTRFNVDVHHHNVDENGRRRASLVRRHASSNILRDASRRDKLLLVSTVDPEEVFWDEEGSNTASEVVTCEIAKEQLATILDEEGEDDDLSVDVPEERNDDEGSGDEEAAWTHDETVAANADAEDVSTVGKLKKGSPVADHWGSDQRGGSMGVHLRDRNVFALEVMPNYVFRLAMLAIYGTFFVMLFYEAYTLANRHTRELPVSVRAKGATGNKPVCLPKADGSCVPADPVITSDEAALLSNTVVVSEGVNASDWVGHGAKPGTPAFNTFEVEFGAFLADPSVLQYDANPELHPFWDDVTGVMWFGYKFGAQETFRKIYLDVHFERLDGSAWPSDMDQIPFPVSIQSYACVRGADCDTIGNWRWQLVHDEQNPNPQRQVKGSLYVARIAMYIHLLGESVIDRSAWRLVASSDPGGAFTECFATGKCASQIHLEGDKTEEASNTIFNIVLFSLYGPFYVWWIAYLYRVIGRPRLWPRENQWLSVLGAGVLLQIGLPHIVLQMMELYDAEYHFNEAAWASAIILSRFGFTLVLFSLACFADAPRRFVCSRARFYVGKTCVCVVFFVCSTIATLNRFPKTIGLDEPGSEIELGRHGYTTAVESRNDKDQRVLATTRLITLSLYLFAFAWAAWTYFHTIAVLQKLPYAITRPVQISYRFFVWATGVWILVELWVLIADVIRVAKENQRFGLSTLDGLDGLVAAIDSMHFFDSLWTAANLLFLSVFSTVSMLLVLPPSRSAVRGAVTHFSSESEQKAAVINALESNSDPEHIMVLDRARLLCICSREAYLPFDALERERVLKSKLKLDSEKFLHDLTVKEEMIDHVADHRKSMFNVQRPLPQKANPKRDSFLPSDSVFPVLKKTPVRLAGSPFSLHARAPKGSTWAMGCRVIARLAEPSDAALHDTKCIILRHVPSGALIVAFRGTATKKQMKTDLMSSKVGVDLDTFLATTSKKEYARLTTEGILSDVLEEGLRMGEITNVHLADLLPRAEIKPRPDYLENAHKAIDDISGLGKIHFGFWSSYNRLRKEVHSLVRQELMKKPGRLLITGHSLGGAQATLCAYDMCRWVLPTVKRELLTKWGKKGRERADDITVSCYTYGSPRVGDRRFADAFDKLVPDTQRIVCDGDVITANPPSFMGYKHVGRVNIFDSSGSILVEPTLIELRFALKRRSKVSSHFLKTYTQVIKLAYFPVVTESELLEIMREAYYGSSPS